MPNLSRRVLRYLLWGWWWFGMAGQLSAQAQPDTTRTLQEARVTVQRTPKALQAATPTRKIDSTALLRQGISDIADALRRLPGTNVRDYGGAGGLKTVSVRGLGAGHTAVFFDGLPVNDVQHGQVNLRPFHTDRLYALELQPGEADALLCPVRALSAATLRLTGRTATPTPPGLHGEAALRCGSFGSAGTDVQLRHALGAQTDIYAGGSFDYARNDYPFRLRNGSLETREQRKNSRLQDWTAETGLSHRCGADGRLDAKIFLTRTRQHLPGMVLLYTDAGDERQQEENYFGQLHYEQGFGPWQVLAAGKFNHQALHYQDYSAQYPGGALRQDYRSREYYGTAGVSRRLGRGWEAATALDLGTATLSTNLTGNPKADRTMYLQALSLRYARRRGEVTFRGLFHRYRDRCEAQRVDQVHRKLTGTASAAYSPLRRPTRHGTTLLSLRVAAKQHFRMPTFSEAYYYHYGATKLKPERTLQFSGGCLLEVAPTAWWPALTLSLDAYGGTVRDRIVSIPRSLYLWQTENFGKVRTRGAEAALSASFRPARRHKLALTAQYSLQRVTDRSDPAGNAYGKQNAYAPLHSGAAAATYENPWLNGSVHLTAASERWSTNDHAATTRLPGYWETGLGLWRTFRTASGHFTVRGDLLNMLDRQYEVVRRYPMPGRSWRLSLNWKF